MGAGGIVRAVGTFCLAKKDVSRENKRRNEKERETCWQSRRGEQRRVRGGGVKAAYGGHQPGSRHHQTRHYGGDEESKHTAHHSHHKAVPSFCQEPNTANYSPQLRNFTPKSMTSTGQTTVTCHSDVAPVCLDWGKLKV